MAAVDTTSSATSITAVLSTPSSPADATVVVTPSAPVTPTYPRTRIIDSEFGKALIAGEAVGAGVKLFRFQGKILDAPNQHTVQLDETKHIHCCDGPEFTSHSCSPNSYFIFDGSIVELVTLRPLAEGEPISFDYNTTEWDMSVKFRCLCKSDNCYQVVQGYRYLSNEQRLAIDPYVSPFIRLRRKQEQEAADKLKAAKTDASLEPVAIFTGHRTPEGAEIVPTSCSKSIYRIGIVEGQYGKALIALENIPVGGIAYSVGGEILPTPNMHTIQISENKHVITHGGPEFTSHSCNPNGVLRFADDIVSLEVIRPIVAGEQITFNYATTEWDMAVKFPCLCGESKCYRMIAGYSHLTVEQRAEIEPYLSPFIRSRASDPVGFSVVFPTAPTSAAATATPATAPAPVPVSP